MVPGLTYANAAGSIDYPPGSVTKFEKTEKPLENSGTFNFKNKSQKLAVTKVIRFIKKGKGGMSFQIVSAQKNNKNYKKRFKINNKTGKVTIIKKTGKGKYAIKAKVKAAGDSNFRSSGWKNVTFKVTIN